jgi:hypothetical protein
MIYGGLLEKAREPVVWLPRGFQAAVFFLAAFLLGAALEAVLIGVGFFVFPGLAVFAGCGGAKAVAASARKSVSPSRGMPRCPVRARRRAKWVRGDELQEGETGVDVACALARAFGDGGDLVAGKVEQTPVAGRLVIGMHVDSETVLDDLPLLGLGVADVDDAGGNGEEFGKLCGAVPPGSADDLEALVIRPYRDGLDETVLPNRFGELVKFRLLERPARVGGGLVDRVDGDVLEGAAVLHEGSP